MSFEVEQKFKITDPAGVESAAHELGARFGDPVEQVDCYFRHPARDFAETDEAFRLRRVGDANFVTYKGPKVDTTTKTRREIELPLPDGSDFAEEFTGLLDALGFSPAAEVRKRRRKAKVVFDGADTEIVLDEVEGLGTFAELEVLAEEEDLDAARDKIAELARRLQLDGSERRSYMEMLLEQRP